jgi:hypothetical protein
MSGELGIGEIHRLSAEWKARADTLRARPPRYVPDDGEIQQLQILIAAAGSPRAFQGWIKAARRRLKKPKGRPQQHDMQWLMRAAVLKRSDKTLRSCRAAIQQVADLERVPNEEAFVRRLFEKLNGRTLEEFAEEWERLGVTISRSWPPRDDGPNPLFGKPTQGVYPASGVRGALWFWT